MPELNAAQRVLDHLNRVGKIQDNVTFPQGLVALFGPLPEGEEPYRIHARRLEALLGQVDKAVNGLKAANFPDDLFVHQVARVRNGLSPSNFNQKWAHVKHFITDAERVCFAWMAYGLRNEEVQLDEADVAALVEQAEALLQSPVIGSLPEHVRRALSDYLRALKQAAADYPISGVEPISRAARDLASELATEVDIVNAAAEGTEEGSDFKRDAKLLLAKCGQVIAKAWDKTVKAADGADKILKLVEHGQKILEVIGKLPPPPG